MRSNLCIILSFLFSSAHMYAQYILAEDFSRHEADNAVENAADPAHPNAGEWVFVAEETGSTVPTVTDGTLSYTDYILSGKGKTLQLAPTNGTGDAVLCLSKTHLPYPCQPEGEFIEGSNEFYTAFMLDLSQTHAEDIQEIFSYYQLDTRLRRGSLCYKLNDGKVAFSFQKNPETPSTSWTKNYDKNQTFLIVVKYGHVCINEKNLGHAEFELYINPKPLRSEEDNAPLRLTAWDSHTSYDNDLRCIGFRQNGQTNMRIGGIRIANSFEEALQGNTTGIADPSTTDMLFFAKGKKIYMTRTCYGELSLYDLSGQLLQTSRIQGKEAVNANFNAGVYILQYEENGNKHAQKIMIQP